MSSEVLAAIKAGIPGKQAPPPVKQIPFSITSQLVIGGKSRITSQIVVIILLITGNIA